MASKRITAFSALVAILAIIGGATARSYPEENSPEYYSPPPPKYEVKQDYYSPPPPPPQYYSSPPPPTEYYSPPPPKYEVKPAEYDYDCQEYADECDFKFLNEKIPTFHLIARGDNKYGPIVVDKHNYPTKVLNPNGDCTVFGNYDDCKDYFYFRGNRVATRTFNIRPVEDFKGKCIRLDISSAQLWDHTNLNPGDGNYKYPEDRRCVIFKTA